MTFDDLGLIPEILRAVKDAGYSEPTPIQQQAIPVVLSGGDVMGGAQTGTGKTAGFTLPLLQQLAPFASTATSPARHPLRALILTPTRELAMQVHESVQTYSKYLPLRSLCIYGGVNMDAQTRELRRGIEIVVATPGRLLDHIQQGSVNLSQVQMLVLDEADRMLDMGFIPDIRRILTLLPQKRQSLLFSATFSNEIKKLADSMLRAPQLIEVARRNTVSETISHVVHPVSTSAKRDLLAHLLKNPDMNQVLVFVSTKFGCSRLSRHLEKEGILVDAIHGDKSQQQRTETLEKFKTGQMRVLVATDVAARGLDIDDLPYVVNFELPSNPEDYVHRIGRTGRAGKRGIAISLVSPEEKGHLSAIEKMIKLTVTQQMVPGFNQNTTPEEIRRLHQQDRKPTERNTRAPRTERERPASTTAPARHTNTRKAVTVTGADFDKPYEPSKTASQAQKPATDDTQNNSTRKSPAVSVLLGGTGQMK